MSHAFDTRSFAFALAKIIQLGAGERRPCRTTSNRTDHRGMHGENALHANPKLTARTVNDSPRSSPTAAHHLTLKRLDALLGFFTFPSSGHFTRIVSPGRNTG